MQLEGATELERRVYEACLSLEGLPASELATRVVSAVSDAGNELQRLRASESNLAMLVGRLVRQVRKHDPQNPVAYKAHGHLERTGLLPNIIDR